MGRRSQPREDGPGIVRVRLTGDEFDAGFLVRILRDHPEVELASAPARYSGGRVYVKVRVHRDGGMVDDARMPGARLRKLAGDAEDGDAR